MLWAVAFIGSASSGNVNGKTLLSLLVIVAWYIHATTINDYADFAIDKINLSKASDRPLLNGDLSKTQFWWLHVTSAVLTIGLSTFFGKTAVEMSLLMLLIDYGYSLKPLRLSDRGLIAQFVLAFAYVYYPLLLGYLSATGAKFPLLLSTSIFMAFMARMLLKDFRDVVGDKQHNKLTFLLRHGPRQTILVSLLFWSLAGIIIGFAIRQPGIYLVLIVAFVEVAILLKRLDSSKNHNQQQTIITFTAKMANALIITLLAHLLCRAQSNLSALESQLIPVTTGLTLLAYNWLRFSEQVNNAG